MIEEREKQRLLKYLPVIYQEQLRKKKTPIKEFLDYYDHLIAGIEKIHDNSERNFDPCQVYEKIERDRNFIYSYDNEIRGKCREDINKTKSEFLSWLASWVDLKLDEGWSDKKKQYLIKIAADLYKYRGTQKGIKVIIEKFFEVEVKLEERLAGMAIGCRSTIGSGDAVLMREADRDRCFRVIFKEGYLSIKQEKRSILKKIITLLDLEKPAHTWYYFWEYPKKLLPALQPMTIGLHTTIGFFYINREVKSG